MPIAQAFAGDMDEMSKNDSINQLNLFN